jgi:hypothetical protein
MRLAASARLVQLSYETSFLLTASPELDRISRWSTPNGKHEPAPVPSKPVRSGHSSWRWDHITNQSPVLHDTQFCSWFFCSCLPQLGRVGATRKLPASYARFFRALGHRIRAHRTERSLSQEDMMSFGFSVRHWQMIEAGRPTTMFTVLRICEAFQLSPEALVGGLADHRRKRKKD